MLWKNPCIAFLIPLVARATYYGASIGDALAISALCAFYGYFLFLEGNKSEPINDAIKNEMADLRTQVTGVKIAIAQRR